MSPPADSINGNDFQPSPAHTLSRPGRILYIVAAVLALAIVGLGIFLVIDRQNWVLLGAGCVCVVAVLIAIPLTNAIHLNRLQARQAQDDLAVLLADRLQQIAVLLGTVSEQQLLSDRAKAVAFRDKDRDALRRAIKEDLARRDWEAALVLVNDMERTFGYAHEAVQYRQEITAHRDDFVRKDINDATTRIENLCRMELWNDALHEAERVKALYPDNEDAMKLPADIESRRQLVKKQLLDRWNDALTRKDVDSAIEIVKRLDVYLTRPEAESIQESVRGVYREKVNQLGAQFMLAWQDHRYPEALRVAEIIIRDFPNSGIAREVREKMDVLRQRAAATPEPVRV